MFKTIPELLNFACEEFGDSDYLFKKTDDGWKGTTYKEAREQARALAAALLSHDLVGNLSLVSEGRPEWVISELGILLSGGTTVPLSIKLLAEELPFRINHSQSKAVAFSKVTIDKVLQVYSSFEEKPKLIYLDSDQESIQRIEAETGLRFGSGLFTLEDLIAQGSEALKIQEVQSQVAAIESDISPDHNATICYTSGTTGNPKGAMLTHQNFCANVTQSTDLFFIPYGLKTLVILPVDHSFAHTIALYAALLRKFSLYFVDARGGAMSILRNIPINLQEVKPDFLLTVPALTQNFMNRMLTAIRKKGGFIEKLFHRGLKSRIIMNGDAWNKPGIVTRFFHFWPFALTNLLIFPKLREVFGGNLRFCISGGAYLDVTQQQFFKAIGVPVYQGYGLTEASPVISTNRDGLHKIGSSGNILPGIECKIVDDSGTELPLGSKGQIIIRGINVMKGYYRNPDATSQTVKDGWLYTGDLGSMDHDGFLYVSGREKALLISPDGEKYSPEEIEEAIVNVAPVISQCMLYCDHKKYTTALISLDSDTLSYLKDKQKITSPEKLLPVIEGQFHKYLSESAYKGRFPKAWTPKTFQILTEPFSEANKMINSTMKMVRYRIHESHSELLEYMYTSEGDHPQNPKNLEAIKTLAF
ncbi:AMP-dependent synthetase/ligase [Spirochaeta lutea]|uniref:AMP-dependent synthetase/ligase domain-containing protein n=1 Tax=Spirochaeta lutea TaxID=1480694 RepID=A0A098QVS3_9SPIO|nr:AMP-binding protein [Spirochaeta lutea]KGE71940.1 hypothetical protein DC28_09080 [Spirochaeta lutea]